MITKKIIIAVVAVVLVIAGWVIFIQSAKTTQNTIPGGPANFNLIFRYGVGAKNELNTYKQTYTRDMVTKSPKKINFTLSNNELTGIYNKISDLKILDKNSSPYTSDTNYGFVTPCQNYYLKVQIDSTETELSWDNCRAEISENFTQFSDYIIKIIESKDAYKKLPEPTGGYL